MCDMVPPSRYHIAKLKYVNLAKFPGWGVTQNGVTQTTGFLTQRMIPLWQSDHATAHFFDGQASAVNQQHGFLQVCWVMRMGQLRQLALAHLDLGSEPPISIQELGATIKLVLAVDTGSLQLPRAESIKNAVRKSEELGGSYRSHFLQSMTEDEFMQTLHTSAAKGKRDHPDSYTTTGRQTTEAMSSRNAANNNVHRDKLKAEYKLNGLSSPSRRNNRNSCKLCSRKANYGCSAPGCEFIALCSDHYQEHVPACIQGPPSVRVLQTNAKKKRMKNTQPIVSFFKSIKSAADPKTPTKARNTTEITTEMNISPATA